MASISSALNSLTPTASFAVHGNEYSGIIWQSPDIPMPDEASVLAEVARLQVIDDANAYKQKRAVEYPSIGDQLDMLYHDKINNTNTWQSAIETVKNKYPKG